MINYVIGDATDPRVPGSKIIAHICNDVGAWGKGFVMSLSARWATPERLYRRWYKEQAEMSLSPTCRPVVKIGIPMQLGATFFVPVASVGSPPEWEQTYVANMIAQSGIASRDNERPIRYPALEQCLTGVMRLAGRIGASVHMPRIGCGLSGGKWSEVGPIVERVAGEVPTYVYDFETTGRRTITRG